MRREHWWPVVVDCSVGSVQIERNARLAGVGENVEGGRRLAVVVGEEGGYRMGSIRIGTALLRGPASEFVAFSGIGGAVAVGRSRSVVVVKGVCRGFAGKGWYEGAPTCGEGGWAGGVGSVVAVEGVDFVPRVRCEPLWCWEGFSGRRGVEGKYPKGGR